MATFDIVAFECKDTSGMADATLVGVDVEVASMTAMTEEETYTVVFETAGEINIEFDGKLYRDPQEFPEELTELIRESHGACLFDGSVDGLMCWANNWFQVPIFDGNGYMLSNDPDIIEANVDELGEDGVREEMETALEFYIDMYC